MRSPLLHFLLIGAALFMLYAVVAPPRPPAPGSRIELTQDDLRQIDIAWTAKWLRPPTNAEWNDLVDSKVREEVLYREALKMGLDQDDVIIKRRLGQKLEFLVEDASAIRDPSPSELESWYKRNGAQFSIPGRATFCHIYFSPDTRGRRAQADAARTLAALKPAAPCNSPAAANLGDRFPEQSFYADRSQDDVANSFGTAFSQSLFRLKTGAWIGPVESGYGWHLVRIDMLTAPRVPPFGEVNRSRVQTAWLDAQREQSKREAFAAIRKKYEVVLPKQRL